MTGVDRHPALTNGLYTNPNYSKKKSYKMYRSKYMAHMPIVINAVANARGCYFQN